MSHIAFIDSSHTYLNTNNSEKYTSVTTIIGSYKNKFDVDYEAEKYVKKHPEIQTVEGASNLIRKYNLDCSAEELLEGGITAEKIKKMWKDVSNTALVEGTKLHFVKEIDTLYNDSNLSEHYNDSIVNLSDLPDGIYPELRVWYDPYKIAGTIDKVTIQRPWVWIEDYKTNKRLLSKTDNYGKYMKVPLQFLPDCAYFHYELQLNIYGWILEKNGFKVKELKIVQKRFDDDKPIPERYKIPFISEVIQRKPVIYPMDYYPHRMNMFLDYDHQLRLAT